MASGFSNFLLREKVRCELQCSMQAQQHEFSHQERGFLGLRGFGLNFQPNYQQGTRNGRFKLVNQRICNPPSSALVLELIGARCSFVKHGKYPGGHNMPQDTFGKFWNEPYSEGEKIFVPKGVGSKPTQLIGTSTPVAQLEDSRKDQAEWFKSPSNTPIMIQIMVPRISIYGYESKPWYPDGTLSWFMDVYSPKIW